MSKAQTDQSANPGSLRGVFGANLRRLSAASPSIAQLCRDLGVNRTQFNRYLNGESFPRPDVLNQICTYFSVDARILLEPLGEFNITGMADEFGNIDLDPYLRKIRGFDHQRLPDGLYRYLSPSFAGDGLIHRTMYRFFSLKNGGKGLHWPIPRGFARHSGQSGLWRDRKQAAICFQHADGFSLSTCSDYAPFIVHNYFGYSHRGMNRVHAGYSAITQTSATNQTQVQPALLERVSDRLADAVHARRHCGQIGMDELPNYQRTYFESWQAG